jgi:hypothetical protein
MIAAVFLALALLLAATPLAAAEPSPEAMAAAKRFMQTLTPVSQEDLAEVFTPMLLQVIGRFADISDPKYRQFIEEDVQAELRRALPSFKDAFVDEETKLYAANFTVAELDALYAFNSSAVGQKYRAFQLTAGEQRVGIIMKITDDFAKDILPRLWDAAKKRGLAAPQ